MVVGVFTHFFGLLCVNFKKFLLFILKVDYFTWTASMTVKFRRTLETEHP